MRSRPLVAALLLLLASSGTGCRFFSSSGSTPAGQVAESGELGRMLDDRPKMRAALESHESLRPWLRTRFAQKRRVIVWDPALPASGQPSEHVPPEGPGGAVRLRVSADWSGLDQLGLAAYELVNMENEIPMAALWNDAKTGRRPRGEFALAMTRLEHRALVEFEDLAKTHGLTPAPEDRMLERVLQAPRTFDAYLEWLTALHVQDGGGGYDPVRYWEESYDRWVPAAESAAGVP